MKFNVRQKAHSAWGVIIRNSPHTFILKGGLGFIVLIAIVQIVLLGINGVRHVSPVLGTRFDGQLIGLPTQPDFRREIRNKSLDRENKKIAVKVLNYTGSVTPRQLGEHVSQNAIADAIMGIGHQGSIWKRIAEQDRALLGARNVSVGATHFDRRLVSAYIATINKKITTAPTNAYFSFDAGTVMIQPDVPGATINAAAATAKLLPAVDTLANGQQIVLPTTVTSAIVQLSTLKPLLSDVQNITQKPLTIVVAQNQVVLSREQLLTLVEPRINQDPKDTLHVQAKVSFNETKLNAAVDTLVTQSEIAPQPAVVSNGRVIKPGKSGLQIEDDHPSVRILAALLQRQSATTTTDVVQIPLIKVDPPLVPSSALPKVDNQKSPTTGGTVYITVDDGPGQFTDQVLDVFKKYNVHATFYVIGRNAQRYPQSMIRMSKEGHTIGNHAFTHTDLTRLSAVAVRTELSTTQAAIKQSSGVQSVNFRPPYGAQNRSVIDIALSLGLSDNLWSLDPHDWAQPGSSVITQRVLAGARPGSVILLHVLHRQTVDALPAIIEGLRMRGFTLP
ncbi:MAG: hypothetical protein NVS1B7_4950 [Candidatus Saccharimonadales bacterium]